MRLKSLGLLLASLMLIPLNTACVSMLAKMALNLATSKTNDLSVCALQARYVTNLFPKDAHTFDMAYYTSTWTEGAGVVMVTCQERNGATLFEIEGTVQVDGQPMEYVAGGTYSKLVAAGDTAPKTISITTTRGQKTSFTVKPAAPVQLVAVNGKKGDSNVDVTKDMTLEFAQADGGFVRVGLISDTNGMRNFSDIGVYKLEKTVKVPAVAFRNPALFKTIGGGMHGKSAVALSTSTKLVNGANYVFVERFEATPIKAEGASAAENLGLSWSWMAVNVKGEVETVPGVAISKTVDGVEFYTTKPAATHGKPLNKAKKFALVAMAVDGTLEVVKDATQYQLGGGVVQNGGGKDQHMYHAWKFPQLPLSAWDQQMERVYSDLTAAFQSDFGITFIPTEDVLKATAYKDMVAASEENTRGKLSHSFRGLKSYAGPRLGTATVVSDRREVQLMKELGVDGLVVVNLSFSLPDEGITRQNCDGIIDFSNNTSIGSDFACLRGEMRFKTKAEFSIIGMPRAYGPQMTTYATGELETAKSVAYTMDEFKDAESLERVFRGKELVKALKTALREQESKAREFGYDAVWANVPQAVGVGT